MNKRKLWNSNIAYEKTTKREKAHTWAYMILKYLHIYIYIDIMHVHQFMTSVSYCIFSKPISTHRKDRQRERD